MIDRTNENDLTSNSTPEPTVTPQFCPLLGGHLRIRVELPHRRVLRSRRRGPSSHRAPPMKGQSIWPNWKSLRASKAEQTAEQRKRLAPRIKEWNFSITGAEAAPINPGTLAVIPLWALSQIELATFAEAGKLLGN